MDFGAFVDIGIKESALIHVSGAGRPLRQGPDGRAQGRRREGVPHHLAGRRPQAHRPVPPEGGRAEGRPRRWDPLREPQREARRPDSPRRGPPVPSTGGRRIAVARKPGSGPARDGAPPARPEPGRPDGFRNPGPGGERGRNPYSQSARPPARGPKPEEDDGTTYNPFADLLKNRKT
ncbi:MAG: hypothetical protein MZV63_13315 [Marinilabiliales bacterium]|nr:hypothetical protein [Marinilabiliales bacterium]